MSHSQFARTQTDITGEDTVTVFLQLHKNTKNRPI